VIGILTDDIADGLRLIHTTGKVLQIRHLRIAG
jgi:hypothetical protein